MTSTPMTKKSSRDVPPQEQRHFFNSFMLGRDIMPEDLYELSPVEMDIFMAELKALLEDPHLPERLTLKRSVAGYYYQLAKIIVERKSQ